MAFCRYCGKPVNQQLCYCTGCGKPIELGQREQNLLQNQKKPKKISGWTVFSLVLMCVITVLIGLYVYELFCYKDRVSLDPYIHVTYSGTDQAGRATVVFEKADFERDLMRQKDSREWFRRVFEWIHTDKAPDAKGIGYLADSIEVRLSSSDSLYNGAVLGLKLRYAKVLADRFSYDFTWTSSGYLVQGLSK